MNLETPTKIAALIAVVAYVVGVLTVGIYVQHNDIPAPDLTAFKAHYIYTGVEVLGLLAAAAAVISLCMLVAERASKAWAVAIGIGLAAVVWFLYAQFLEGGFTSPKPLRALWLVLVSGACALFIWATWGGRRRPRATRTSGSGATTSRSSSSSSSARPRSWRWSARPSSPRCTRAGSTG